MRILSNFKDYYDYLAYQYGVDDQIVFKRNRIIPLNGAPEFISLPISDNINNDAVIPKNHTFHNYLGSSNIFYYEEGDRILQFESVSIVGTIYYYLYEYDRLKKSSSMRMPKREDYILYNKWREKMGFDGCGQIVWPEIWGGKKNWQHIKSHSVGIVQPGEVRMAYDIPIKLHKELQAPILWKKSRLPDNTACLLMPILSKISGFSGCYPPDKICRDIYNFLQEIRQSPDTNPPVEVDNKSKILKHGFDLTKSFRQPANNCQKNRNRRKGNN